MSDDAGYSSDQEVADSASHAVADKLAKNLKQILDAQQTYLYDNAARLSREKSARMHARCAGSFFGRLKTQRDPIVTRRKPPVCSSALFATDKSPNADKVRRWMIRLQDAIRPLSYEHPDVTVMKDDMRAALLYLAFRSLTTDDWLGIVSTVGLPSESSLEQARAELVRVAKGLSAVSGRHPEEAAPPKVDATPAPSSEKTISTAETAAPEQTAIETNGKFCDQSSAEPEVHQSTAAAVADNVAQPTTSAVPVMTPVTTVVESSPAVAPAMKRPASSIITTAKKGL